MDEFMIVPMPGAKKPGITTKMRIQNVPCTITDDKGNRGQRHDYESWGIDVVHMGTGYFDEVEVWVCRNPDCMRAKNIPVKARKL
jgi:hypothetical protein